jgi:ubiquinone/menaquinone biosynthesis C-methylase UbiE
MPDTTEEFSEKMTAILNYGALNLALAIGYRLGLFDTMDSFDVPRSTAEIAQAADLNPRYVKEWLSVMVTGGIIEVSQNKDGHNGYLLSGKHADLLARRAGNSNLGVYTQEIPLLTMSAMDAVMDGFRSGDGVSYEHYPRVHSFMTELAEAKHRRVLVDKFLPSVAEGEIVRRLQDGIRVCDLGCGQGVAIILMARAFPNSTFVGFDISEPALETARTEAAKLALDNLEFFTRDAATLASSREFSNAFDYVTAFDAIHDQTRPFEVLRGIYAILKPGAAFSMIDIGAASNVAENRDHPMGPFLYTVSLMHCMPVGLVDGGTGLGMMWGREKALEMLQKAGFEQIQVQDIPDDHFNLHYFCTK